MDGAWWRRRTCGLSGTVLIPLVCRLSSGLLLLVAPAVASHWCWLAWLMSRQWHCLVYSGLLGSQCWTPSSLRPSPLSSFLCPLLRVPPSSSPKNGSLLLLQMQSSPAFAAFASISPPMTPEDVLGLPGCPGATMPIRCSARLPPVAPYF